MAILNDGTLALMNSVVHECRSLSLQHQEIISIKIKSHGALIEVSPGDPTWPNQEDYHGHRSYKSGQLRVIYKIEG